MQSSSATSPPEYLELAMENLILKERQKELKDENAQLTHEMAQFTDENTQLKNENAKLQQQLYEREAIVAMEDLILKKGEELTNKIAGLWQQVQEKDSTIAELRKLKPSAPLPTVKVSHLVALVYLQCV